MSTPSLTVRLEPALRYLEKHPGTRAHYLSVRFGVEAREIDSWVKTHNGGSFSLNGGLVDKIKARDGGLAVSRVGEPVRQAQGSQPVEKTKLTPVQPARVAVPVAVKLSATSDMAAWLAAQRARVVGEKTVYQVEVTPGIAETWLRFNQGNRKPSMAKIKRFAAIMKAGNWRLNGEGLKFSVSGRLLDGQSRLLACIEAGGTVGMEVRGGIPDELQTTMDAGEGRKAGHTLEMLGEASPAVLAPALRFLHKFSRGTTIGDGGGVILENQEVGALLKKHPGLKTSVGWVVGEGGKLKGLMPLGEAAFLHYLFAQSDAVKCTAFFTALATDLGLTREAPVYNLRERLLLERTATAKISRKHRFALCIKAWNAHFAGEKMSRLRFSEGGEMEEAFPEIAGMKGKK